MLVTEGERVTVRFVRAPLECYRHGELVAILDPELGIHTDVPFPPPQAHLKAALENMEGAARRMLGLPLYDDPIIQQVFPSTRGRDDPIALTAIKKRYEFRGNAGKLRSRKFDARSRLERAALNSGR